MSRGFTCRKHSRFVALYLAAGGLMMLAGCHTGVRAGDTVALFPTVAHQHPDGTWAVPISGWICEPRIGDRTFLMLSHFLNLEDFIKSPQQRMVLQKRLEGFIVDNKTGRRIEITIADRRVRLGESAEGGLFNFEITLPADAFGATETPSSTATRWVSYQTRAHRRGAPFQGRIMLLNPTGLSVISDIDDTVRVTEVKNTKAMIQHTFLEDFQPVAGMPELYAHWAQSYAADFHYISTSPHQLIEPMTELVRQNYPPGSMDLRLMRYQGNALKFIIEMMEAPPEWKLEHIGRLLENFPQRQFVLVGDSGQSDPEVYTQLARKYPEQVKLIVIRDVTCQDTSSPRYQQALGGLPPGILKVFREPAEVKDALEPIEATQPAAGNVTMQ